MQPKSVLNHCADMDTDTALLIPLSASTGTRAPALWLARGNQSYTSTAELSCSQQSSAHGRELGSAPGPRLLSQSRVQAQNRQPRSPRSGSGSRTRTSCFPNSCPSCKWVCSRQGTRSDARASEQTWVRPPCSCRARFV